MITVGYHSIILHVFLSIFTLSCPAELVQDIHGQEGPQRADVLDRSRKHETQVGVEILLIVSGEAEPGEASVAGIALHFLH